VEKRLSLSDLLAFDKIDLFARSLKVSIIPSSGSQKPTGAEAKRGGMGRRPKYFLGGSGCDSWLDEWTRRASTVAGTVSLSLMGHVRCSNLSVVSRTMTKLFETSFVL